MKIGIAVVGVGRWGVHLVRNFLAHPQAELKAILDPSRERLENLKQTFDLSSDISLIQDWQELLTIEGIEGIAIATPASTHYSLIVEALNRGWHVFCEKPLTLDTEQSLELCRLAQQQKRQLFVDHTYLFHPAVHQGQAVVQAGSLGQLRYGYATRTHLGPVRQDVDALWDLAIHDIAIFNHWLGEFPIQVAATGSVFLPENSEILPHNTRSSPVVLPLQDLVWVTLTYPSGFQCVIHLCWLNPDKQRRLCVVGSQGTLIFDEMDTAAPLTVQHGHFKATPEHPYTPIDLRREVVELPNQEPLKQVCDRFLHSIQTQEPSPISSGWVGTQLVHLLCCLTESLRHQGQPIAVPPLSPRES